MQTFIDRLEDQFKRYPGRIAVKSEACPAGITYSELDTLSGKVYSFLSSRGVGKEDMVLLCLPRDVSLIASIVGILKAGAAFTIVENDDPRDRVAYIKDDCACKLVLTTEIYNKILSFTPTFGHAPRDSHSACFAVYTSGSTGTPKGVLHEYGKLELAIAGLEYAALPTSAGSMFAIISPFHFVAAVLQVFYSLYCGNGIYVVPYSVGKNIETLKRFFIDEKIEETFIAPSMLEKYSLLSPHLVNVFTGGEICRGGFLEGVNIINCYASSESGIMIATFNLDPAQDGIPVGKNHCGMRIELRDEDGSVITQPRKSGEIAVQNAFTRGYIHLPEKTAETFADGMYFTGDIGYFDEKGNLYVSGRKDEMIKINGNRIEPSEIESAVKKAFGVRSAVAKGFNENGKSFICAYLLSSELRDASLLDETGKLIYSPEKIFTLLSEQLPYYMIPAHYVVLDEFPLNANGKIVRKSLCLPACEEENDSYQSPRNAVEKYICTLFEDSLHLDHVGVKDDYFMIGGDSISAMEMVSHCDLTGIGVSDVYKLRTPEKLAGRFDISPDQKEDIDELNRVALMHSQPLLPEMVDVLDFYSIMPQSTMWNIAMLLRLKKDVDLNRLSQAIDRVLTRHPALSTQLFVDEHGSPRQKYCPRTYQKIEKKAISEEQLNQIKDCLSYPFAIYNASFQRKMIYVTKKAAYLFMDFYHLIADGSSIQLILNQIEKCYEDPDYVPETDYYYLILQNYQDSFQEAEPESDADYFKEKLAKLKSKAYSTLPKLDFESSKWEYGWFEQQQLLSKADYEASAIGKKIKKNEFFMSALALAMTVFNQTPHTALQWIFNGRTRKEYFNAVGLLFHSLQLFSFVKPDCTVGEYFDDISSQVNFTMAHCRYKASDTIGKQLEPTVYFLYQYNIFNYHKYGFIDEYERLVSKENASDSFMDFEIIDTDGEDGFRCTIKYSSSHYKKESIEALFSIYERIVTNLIAVTDIDNTALEDIFRAAEG